MSILVLMGIMLGLYTLGVVLLVKYDGYLGMIGCFLFGFLLVYLLGIPKGLYDNRTELVRICYENNVSVPEFYNRDIELIKKDK